jgi:hypothetical protein
MRACIPPELTAEEELMAIDLSDVRRRMSRIRAPEISTDDLAPAVDRAGRTLRDWRKSTEAALASLGDLSLDSLPQMSLDSLPGRRRPSPVRQNGPFVAVALLGVIAGVIIGWWMASTARLGSATSARPGAQSAGAHGTGDRAAANRTGGVSDAGWSVGRQSADEPAASGQSESTPDAWRGVGPGQPAEPITAPELASRTARTD